MNVAIIDLGTNTFNLLIATISNGIYTTQFVTKEFVKLGEGGINIKTIQPLAFKRGLDTLLDYKLLCEQYNCEKIIGIATSAIRNATNGQEFVKQAKDISNIDIFTIDGNQEADFIYKGTIGAIDLKDGVNMIMDVGGGSTEFIICDQQKVYWKKSVEVGVTRLFEGFHKEDPIALDNIQHIKKHLDNLLEEVISQAKKYKVTTLVGSSGAFTSMANIILCKKNQEDILKTSTAYDFSLEDFTAIHNLLIQTTLKERLEIEGLIKERAPMMVVGSILVDYVLNEVGVQYFRLSRYSLKEGVAIAVAQNEFELKK